METEQNETDHLEASNNKPKPKKRSIYRTLVDWSIVILVAFLLSQALRTWVFASFYIPSGSMESTLLINDKILVNKLAYDLHGVNRGDIVVFSNPPADTGEAPGTDLVKRVIGLPGETIWSAPNGTIYINGKPLSEPWLNQSAIKDPGPRVCSVLVTQREVTGNTPCMPYKIPANFYFMMGDNRGYSMDSRYFGAVNKSYFVGKVDLIYWRHGFIYFHLF